MTNEIVSVPLRCPIRTTTEILGRKWKLLIFLQSPNQPFKLSELKRQIPDISEKILFQELKILSDNSLVKYINFGEVPTKSKI